MLPSAKFCALFAFACVATAALPLRAAPVMESRALRPMFAQPPVDFTTGPLWVWNDQLTEEQIRGTLRDLASQGMHQAYVHPRPGLITPYLSPEWFRLWKCALDEAAKVGVQLWIYDENSYPSGFAGGLVPEAMPESRGMGLVLASVDKAPTWDDALISVYRVNGDTTENVTARAKAGEALPAGKYITAKIAHPQPAPWYANHVYVNLLTPGVTQKFLEVTFDPYRKEVGDKFGNQIKGTFTDEPHLRPAGGLPWCDDLPEQFQKRWHYSLIDALPSLTAEVGDWRRVRHNYFQLVNELFAERWGKPYFEFCAANHLEMTGHYWEHEWPNARTVPDNMTMYAWEHRPGIDTLMNEYADGPNAQFGNARAVREIASVANQLGRARTTVEAYGAGGWNLRFEDMKRIGDWLQVLGANSIVEHLSYVSLRGGRKRDHPQSFSYHEPWWPEFHVPATYLSRLSAVLTQGEQRNDVLLLEPTTSAWMYNVSTGTAEQLKALGNDFQATVNAFEAAQVEYDIGSEYILARHGSVKGDTMVVGERSYHVVVLPQHTENLNSETVALLEKFEQTGGLVIGFDATPNRVDGVRNGRASVLPWQPGWKTAKLEATAPWLAARTRETFSIRRAADDKGILFHQRRQLTDGQLVFLVNTSIDHPSTGTVAGAGRGIERWDPVSGEMSPCAFRAEQPGVATEFNLPPAGSLLLFISNTPVAPAAAATTAAEERIAPKAAPAVERTEPNVLTLDFVDVTAGGETKKDLYCYNAGVFAFQKNGERGNPWERSIQFRDEIIRHAYAKDSGFTASYRFTVAERVPDNLTIVIERPDLYTITCNGKPVTAKTGAWWLDKAFGEIPLGGVAQVGENTVTIQAAPLTYLHEIESAYLRGDFRLRAAKAGFVVVPDAPLQLGPWKEQGHPFYSAGVVYREKFNVTSVGGSYAVALPSWFGSVAKVIVNGREAGVIGWAPWRCDVTSGIRPGENTIEVVVIGTLKNLLGPHHQNPALGRAWPTMFQAAPKRGRAPGTEYSVIGYGLNEPFTLIHTPSPKVVTTAAK